MKNRRYSWMYYNEFSSVLLHTNPILVYMSVMYTLNWLTCIIYEPFPNFNYTFTLIFYPKLHKINKKENVHHFQSKVCLWLRGKARPERRYAYLFCNIHSTTTKKMCEPKTNKKKLWTLKCAIIRRSASIVYSRANLRSH